MRWRAACEELLNLLLDRHRLPDAPGPSKQVEATGLQVGEDTGAVAQSGVASVDQVGINGGPAGITPLGVQPRQLLGSFADACDHAEKCIPITVLRTEKCIPNTVWRTEEMYTLLRGTLGETVACSREWCPRTVVRAMMRSSGKATRSTALTIGGAGLAAVRNASIEGVRN